VTVAERLPTMIVQPLAEADQPVLVDAGAGHDVIPAAQAGRAASAGGAGLR
jgi:hypothetical protein